MLTMIFVSVALGSTNRASSAGMPAASISSYSSEHFSMCFSNLSYRGSAWGALADSFPRRPAAFPPPKDFGLTYPKVAATYRWLCWE